jgi:hypothetical protein
MRDFEEALARRFSGARIALAGLILGAAGVLPLLLYGVFGPADGNPIGLGLLAVVSVPIAGGVTLMGLVKMAVEFLVGGGR